MNPIQIPQLKRSTKIHPESSECQSKTFEEMLEEVTKVRIRTRTRKEIIPTFHLEMEQNDLEEKYSWVDTLLEEMHSTVEEEEEDVIDKNRSTFYHWSNNNMLEPNADEEFINENSYYASLDSRLEDMYNCVEEEDDEEKDQLTFDQYETVQSQ